MSPAEPPPIPKAKPPTAEKPKRRPKAVAKKPAPLWDVSMTRAELAKVALAEGLAVKYRTKRTEIITMLEGIK